MSARTLAPEVYPSDDIGQLSTEPSYYPHCSQRRKEKPRRQSQGMQGCVGGVGWGYLDPGIEHGECRGGPDQRIGYVIPLHQPKAERQRSLERSLERSLSTGKRGL